MHHLLYSLDLIAYGNDTKSSYFNLLIGLNPTRTQHCPLLFDPWIEKTPITPALSELVLVLPLVEFETSNSSLSSRSSTMTANPDLSSYAKYLADRSADVLGSGAAKIVGLATIYKMLISWSTRKTYWTYPRKQMWR